MYTSTRIRELYICDVKPTAYNSMDFSCVYRLYCSYCIDDSFFFILIHFSFFCFGCETVQNLYGLFLKYETVWRNACLPDISGRVQIDACVGNVNSGTTICRTIHTQTRAHIHMGNGMLLLRQLKAERTTIKQNDDIKVVWHSLCFIMIIIVIIKHCAEQ